MNTHRRAGWELSTMLVGQGAPGQSCEADLGRGDRTANIRAMHFQVARRGCPRGSSDILGPAMGRKAGPGGVAQSSMASELGWGFLPGKKQDRRGRGFPPCRRSALEGEGGNHKLLSPAAGRKPPPS